MVKTLKYDNKHGGIWSWGYRLSPMKNAKKCGKNAENE
jgi:hypothetical protein